MEREKGKVRTPLTFSKNVLSNLLRKREGRWGGEDGPSWETARRTQSDGAGVALFRSSEKKIKLSGIRERGGPILEPPPRQAASYVEKKKKRFA